MTHLQGVLFVVLALLFAAGAAALAARLLRTRRAGISIRMQIFFVLTAASFGLAVSFIALLLSPVSWFIAAPSDATLRLGFAVLLLAVVAAIASVFIGWFIGRPLERLTQAAQRIAAGERQAKLPVPRGREVRALTEAFELMRTELEERHVLETFIGDLSHELKNPIAAIRASSEVLSDAMERDPESARRFLHRIDEAAAKLDHLTADLLTLARLEAHGPVRTAIPLDLCGVLDKATQNLRATATERGVTITTRVPDIALVRGEAPALQRALENLLHNACNYAPAGSSVDAWIEVHDGELAILVTDHGPGVDSTLAARAFERFTTTRQSQGGTGGLSCVHAPAMEPPLRW